MPNDEFIKVNEKPIELMEMMIAHYRFTTSRGDVILQMPHSIKESELQGVKAMFAIILEQASEWSTD